jgi:hypothetical protein
MVTGGGGVVYVAGGDIYTDARIGTIASHFNVWRKNVLIPIR